MHRLNRRHFLGAAASTAAVAFWPGLAAAAKPVVRNGKPHMKLGLAAYSFNRLLPRRGPRKNDNATMTLEDVIDIAAGNNCDAVELTSYYFPEEVTNEYLMSIKERCFRLGLDISGTAIGNNFCVAEGPAWDEQLAMTREWIDYAALMDAPVIRIFAGTIPKGDTEEAAFTRCVRGINESLKYAAEKGVVLALENHGGITATPEQLLKIVHAVDESPWFGINFDSGNFHTADPYGDLAKIAPYALNAQIKVAISPDNKKEAADLPRIVEILRQANYRGYVVLEYEESDDPATAVPKYLAELRSLLNPPVSDTE